ncbi:hypothetical protein DW781_10435 [Olsenella sp. AM30-3LB]|uniref:hypothetical protein n=1 Tax=Olsenella sp. AM30-3LB TaxID=2292359 RepID=UPI000E4E782E|nr:hypothetical protein [Olsenella sp. AM30-3LB]RHD71606.1 hypothetical protein DW781_10435 [Olsenella sp. AM30-3LB]
MDIIPQGDKDGTYADTLTSRKGRAGSALNVYLMCMRKASGDKRLCAYTPPVDVTHPGAFTADDWQHHPSLCAVACFASKSSWLVCDAIDKRYITANEAFSDAWAFFAHQDAAYKRKHNPGGALHYPRDQVRTLAVKFYDEQIPGGADALKALVTAFDPKWEVFLFEHDMDKDANSDFWLPACKKRHYHLYVRLKSGERFKILPTLLKLGIYFRVLPRDRGYIVGPNGKAFIPFPDLELWCKGGVTTCGDFCSAVLYGTHETAKAQREGKYQYAYEGDDRRMWTNVSMERYKSIRDGALASREGTKATTREMMHLYEVARELGRRLENFDEWFDSLGWKFCTNAKAPHLRKSYDVGVKEAVERLQATGILRTCVFIQGPPGVGKTYAVHQALLALGLAEAEIYAPTATGTGKYDELAPYHKAIALDDNTGSAILPMTDSYPCKVYRRGSGDRWWLGSYYVATSNLCFHDWAAPSVLRQAPKAKPSSSVVGRLDVADGETDEDKALMDAALSRFYLVRVVPHGDDRPPTVSVDYRCNRGTAADVAARDRSFDAFLRAFRRSITEKWLIDHGYSAEDMAAYLRVIDAADAVDGVVQSLCPEVEVSVADASQPRDPHAPAAPLVITARPPEPAGPGTPLAYSLDDGAHVVDVTFAHPVVAVDDDSRQAARDFLSALAAVPTGLVLSVTAALADMAPSRSKFLGRFVPPTSGVRTDTLVFAPPGCVDDPPRPDPVSPTPTALAWALAMSAVRMVFVEVSTRVLAEVAA